MSIPNFSFSSEFTYLPKITGLEAEYGITMTSTIVTPVTITFQPLNPVYEIVYNGSVLSSNEFTFNPIDQGNEFKFSVRTKSTMLSNMTNIQCIVRHIVNTINIYEYTFYNSRLSVISDNNTFKSSTPSNGPSIGVDSLGNEYVIMANDRTLLDSYIEDIDTLAHYDYTKIITTNITDFSGLFQGHNFTGAVSTSQDISGWDTSNVTDISNLVNGVTVFEADLSKWNVSKVTNMDSSFLGANSFNSDISSWNTSKVENMSNTFNGATIFNANISEWNVSNVINMNGMFANASSFNRDLCRWNVSKVTNMENMFNGATSFNNYIGGWNVILVTNMDSMFENAILFNQNLSFWNVTSFSLSGPSNFNLGSNATWVGNSDYQPKWGSIPNTHVIESSGVPVGTLGIDDQFYVDIIIDPKNIYGPKIGTDWGTPINFTGNVIQGFGKPGSNIGLNTDIYIDISKNDLYGPKGSVTSGSWGFPTSAPQDIHQGNGTPENILGQDGDFYLDLDTNELYGPKNNDDWGNPSSVEGNIIIGTGAPLAATGNIGDYYINDENNEIYGPKTSLGWGIPVKLETFIETQPEISGEVIKAEGLPNSGIGNVGDYYIDETSNIIYGPKTSSGWPSSGSFLNNSGNPRSTDFINYIINEASSIWNGYWGLILILIFGAILIAYNKQ